METLQSVAPWVVDGFVVLSLIIMTVGVYGLAAMPDIYMKLQAVSKASFLGVMLLTLLSFATKDSAVITRGILIIGALTLTVPISAHVVASAAVRRNDRMRTPDAVNESPFLLNKADSEYVGDSGDARLRTLFGE